MANSIIEEFIRAYTAVSGFAHRVAGEIEAARTIADIAGATATKRIALAQLSPSLTGQTETACAACGIEVLKEPFSAESLPHVIDQCSVGVTGIAKAIAQTGTLIEVSTNDAVRLVSALPRTHIGVVRASDILEELADAAAHVRASFEANPRNCVVSFLSGPSRTGDIEMILTLGVHGPEAAHAIIIED
jgi:L-lactate dehydrogenase complex protein LldG